MANLYRKFLSELILMDLFLEETAIFKKIHTWGRSFDEYKLMFSLSELDLNNTVLSCADGVSSFNFECTNSGKNVISCDPIYKLKKELIVEAIYESFSKIIDHIERNKQKYIWNYFSSIPDLIDHRQKTTKEFLNDFENNSNRYISAELPNLPFENNRFNLSLVSHFLFLYSQNLTLEFHIQAISELLRVAKEVRIFPLITNEGHTSPYVNRIIDIFSLQNISVSIEEVQYHFLRGANKMMKLRAKT